MNFNKHTAGIPAQLVSLLCIAGLILIVQGIFLSCADMPLPPDAEPAQETTVSAQRQLPEPNTNGCHISKAEPVKDFASEMQTLAQSAGCDPTMDAMLDSSSGTWRAWLRAYHPDSPHCLELAIQQAVLLVDGPDGAAICAVLEKESRCCHWDGLQIKSGDEGEVGIGQIKHAPWESTFSNSQDRVMDLRDLYDNIEICARILHCRRLVQGQQPQPACRLRLLQHRPSPDCESVRPRRAAARREHSQLQGGQVRNERQRIYSISSAQR